MTRQTSIIDAAECTRYTLLMSQLGQRSLNSEEWLYIFNHQSDCATGQHGVDASQRAAAHSRTTLERVQDLCDDLNTAGPSITSSSHNAGKPGSDSLRTFTAYTNYNGQAGPDPSATDALACRTLQTDQSVELARDASVGKERLSQFCLKRPISWAYHNSAWWVSPGVAPQNARAVAVRTVSSLRDVLDYVNSRQTDGFSHGLSEQETPEYYFAQALESLACNVTTFNAQEMLSKHRNLNSVTISCRFPQGVLSFNPPTEEWKAIRADNTRLCFVVFTELLDVAPREHDLRPADEMLEALILARENTLEGQGEGDRSAFKKFRAAIGGFSKALRSGIAALSRLVMPRLSLPGATSGMAERFLADPRSPSGRGANNFCLAASLQDEGQECMSMRRWMETVRVTLVRNDLQRAMMEENALTAAYSYLSPMSVLATPRESTGRLGRAVVEQPALFVSGQMPRIQGVGRFRCGIAYQKHDGSVKAVNRQPKLMQEVALQRLMSRVATLEQAGFSAPRIAREVTDDFRTFISLCDTPMVAAKNVHNYVKAINPGVAQCLERSLLDQGSET